METDGKIKTKIWCQPCITVDKEQREAVAFCVRCADYLCINCTSEHGKNKQSRNHTILSGNDMPGDCKMFEDMKRLMTCQVHTDIGVSFKCVDHDTFVCAKCVTANHRGCEKLEDVCNIESNSEDVITRLKEESTNVKAVLTQKHENIACMSNEKTRIEKERKEFIERVNKHMLKLTEASRKHTDMVAQNAVCELTKVIEKCTDIAKQEEYYQDLVEVAIKHGTKSEKVTVIDFVGKELQRLGKEIKELSNGKYACLRFEPTKQFEDILSFGDVLVEYNDKQKSTGKHKIEVSSDEFTEQEKQPGSTVSKTMNKLPSLTLSKGSSAQAEQNMCDQMHTRVSFMSRQINKKSTYKIRTNSDKQICSVNGIVLVEDKCYIVITECSNMKIKLLRRDFTISMSVVLEAKPIDICKAGNSTVAVLSDNKTISIFCISKESICLTERYDTTLQGLSITCDTKKGDLIIMFSTEGKEESDGNNVGEIHTHSLQNYGNIKGKTNIFKTNLGCRNTFSNSASIHFSNKRKLLISAKRKVHCLNIPSADALPVEDWFYKEHGFSPLKDVSDIDTDNEGNAYICGKTSCNVHQVSGKMYRNNRVLIPDITNPLSVCVDSQNEVLLVGCDGDDFIHEYKFK